VRHNFLRKPDSAITGSTPRSHRSQTSDAVVSDRATRVRIHPPEASCRNIAIALILAFSLVLLSKAVGRTVKWAAIFAVAGAVWMILVLQSGSLALATYSNYPGVFAARWVQYRGIGPSATTVWTFKIWLVLTSAIEWVAVGAALRVMMRRCDGSGTEPILN
jgi:hypothetical protein